MGFRPNGWILLLLAGGAIVEDMEALERTIQALQHDLDVTAKEHR